MLGSATMMACKSFRAWAEISPGVPHEHCTEIIYFYNSAKFVALKGTVPNNIAYKTSPALQTSL